MTVSGYATDVVVDADRVEQLSTTRRFEVDVGTTSYEQRHIPGAIAWNWTSQLADGIRRDIAARDAFGYDRVRNYDGSWTECGSLIGAPIEKPVAIGVGV